MITVTVEKRVYVARDLPHAAVRNLYCLCLRRSWLHVSASRVSGETKLAADGGYCSV